MTQRAFGPVLIGVILVFTLAVYGSLPDQIPIHWNVRGEADDWIGKWPGAFALPAVALAIRLLIPLLRRIDPRRANYERFDETFWLLVNVAVLFFGLLQVVALGTALGWPIDMARVVLAAVAILFIALGNYLPRVRSNWWMGVRTPWTLENEAVWRSTHRLAGWTFVLGGALALLALLLPEPLRLWVSLAGLVGAGVVPVVYSYFAWRRERVANP